MKKYLFVTFFLLSTVIPPLQAQELEGTRGIGLSGALRGTVGLNESIYYNPSAFAFSQRYSIEAQSFFLPPQQGEPSAWVYSGSVVDSHNDFFAGGLGYYRKTRARTNDGAEGKEIENAYHLALSKVLAPYLALGLTGKYIHVESPMTDTQAVNMDVGSFLVLTPAIQLGLTGHNILGSRENLKRKIGLGTRIQAWKFLYTSIDALKVFEGNTMENVSLHSALEVVHENGVVFQAGFALSDKAAQNLYGFGAGWSQYKFGAFYAFQNSMDGLRRSTHALSFRVFF